MKTVHAATHKGPHLGMLALIFTFLFNTGLYFVISLSGKPPYFPGPWEPAETIANYFHNFPKDVLMCAFFQFGAAIPLGLYTVSIISRLKFLGVKAAGPYIALFGLLAAADLLLSALVLWVMSYPGIAENAAVVRTLYYLTFAIGGVGYSVPLGLLIAGIAVSTGFMKLLPRWLVWLGIGIALAGELSWLSLVFPNLLFLIPLTRFPGFIWLIIAGFKLPKARIND